MRVIQNLHALNDQIVGWLATSLPVNHLYILCIIGNNVPQDILKAITVAIKLNGERESARSQENARTEKMIRTIEKIELENTMQVLYIVHHLFHHFVDIGSEHQSYNY